MAYKSIDESAWGHLRNENEIARMATTARICVYVSICALYQI